MPDVEAYARQSLPYNAIEWLGPLHITFPSGFILQMFWVEPGVHDGVRTYVGVSSLGALRVGWMDLGGRGPL
jgi:hypothetical protein